MPKQTTKRCHWVSQSYLRSFAADPDKRKKIWRLSKNDGGPQLKPIEKVAVRFHLYAPMGPDGRRDDALEKKLAHLEKFFGDPIWAAVCNDFTDLRWEPLRKMVALIVAVTYLRNPLQFQAAKELHLKTIGWTRQEVQTPQAPGPTPADYGANEEELKAAWNAMIGEAAWLAELLLTFRWSVIFSEQPVFITSDNPVMVQHPSLKFRGFADAGTFITFPLSPTRILMMDHRQDELDAGYYPLRYDPASMNGLIWRNAIDHMFSPQHPYTICADMLAEAERMGLAC